MALLNYYDDEERIPGFDQAEPGYLRGEAFDKARRHEEIMSSVGIIRKEKQRLEGRLKELQKESEMIEEELTDIMIRLNEKAISSPLYTIKLNSRTNFVVLREELVPEECIRYKASIDKKALNRLVKENPEEADRIGKFEMSRSISIK